VNEARLRKLAVRFAAALRSSDALRTHLAAQRRRVARAQALLTLVRIPALGEHELRELFFDTEAFGFWINKEWEFTHRLQAVGEAGLREALAELVSRGQLGATHEDLRAIWSMRGLGTLLASELLAYRFPERYWIYSPNATLPALALLGDDVKDRMPRGQRSDPHVYLALAPRMLRVREALAAAGIEPADYLSADTFLLWVKRTLGERGTEAAAGTAGDAAADGAVAGAAGAVEAARGGADANAVERALQEFDRVQRATARWAGWEAAARPREYAVRWHGRKYPAREIARMASGVADLGAREGRAYLRERGFVVAAVQRRRGA
jgi:hypothetical protein